MKVQFTSDDGERIEKEDFSIIDDAVLFLEAKGIDGGDIVEGLKAYRDILLERFNEDHSCPFHVEGEGLCKNCSDSDLECAKNGGE